MHTSVSINLVHARIKEMVEKDKTISIRVNEVAPGLDNDRQRFHKATDEYFNLVNPQGCLMLDGKLYSSDKESKRALILGVLKGAIATIESTIAAVESNSGKANMNVDYSELIIVKDSLSALLGYF